MIRQLFEAQMSMRQERTLGVVLFVVGLLVAGAAVMRMGPDKAVHAQTMSQSAPMAQGDRSAPPPQ